MYYVNRYFMTPAVSKILGGKNGVRLPPPHAQTKEKELSFVVLF
jgi:hypothetical protein